MKIFVYFINFILFSLSISTLLLLATIWYVNSKDSSQILGKSIEASRFIEPTPSTLPLQKYSALKTCQSFSWIEEAMSYVEDYGSSFDLSHLDGDNDGIPCESLPSLEKRSFYGGEFHDYACTQDCSGHEAGYNWAQENGITDEYDCSGNSDSFIEGCMAYAQENTYNSFDEY